MRKTVITAVGAAVGLIAGPAGASVVINVTQVGSNVMTSATGSLNITGLTPVTTAVAGNSRIEGSPFAVNEAASDLVYGYGAWTGPLAIGAGTVSTEASSHTGGDFDFSYTSNGTGPLAYLPTNYISGTVFSAGATYNNTTIAALGLTLGQYVYTLGTQTVTINVGSAAAVPEIASWSMMIFGMGAVGYALRRRNVAMQMSFAG